MPPYLLRSLPLGSSLPLPAHPHPNVSCTCVATPRASAGPPCCPLACPCPNSPFGPLPPPPTPDKLQASAGGCQTPVLEVPRAALCQGKQGGQPLAVGTWTLSRQRCCPQPWGCCDPVPAPGEEAEASFLAASSLKLVFSSPACTSPSPPHVPGPGAARWQVSGCHRRLHHPQGKQRRVGASIPCPHHPALEEPPRTLPWPQKPAARSSPRQGCWGWEPGAASAACKAPPGCHWQHQNRGYLQSRNKANKSHGGSSPGV